jgi:hypothetical protein
MAIRQRRYSIEELSRRGTALYEQIRPQVEAGNRGKIVAIDIDTGEYEVGDNTLMACERLIARSPDAQIWSVRIGYPAVHRYGSRLLPRRA